MHFFAQLKWLFRHSQGRSIQQRCFQRTTKTGYLKLCVQHAGTGIGWGVGVIVSVLLVSLSIISLLLTPRLFLWTHRSRNPFTHTHTHWQNCSWTFQFMSLHMSPLICKKWSDDWIHGGIQKGRVGGFILVFHCSLSKGQIHFLLQRECKVTDRWERFKLEESWNSPCWINKN